VGSVENVKTDRKGRRNEKRNNYERNKGERISAKSKERNTENKMRYRAKDWRITAV
jgi:hypothetical protein